VHGPGNAEDNFFAIDCTENRNYIRHNKPCCIANQRAPSMKVIKHRRCGIKRMKILAVKLTSYYYSTPRWPVWQHERNGLILNQIFFIRRLYLSPTLITSTFSYLYSSLVFQNVVRVSLLKHNPLFTCKGHTRTDLDSPVLEWNCSYTISINTALGGRWPRPESFTSEYPVRLVWTGVDNLALPWDSFLGSSSA